MARRRKNERAAKFGKTSAPKKVRQNDAGSQGGLAGGGNAPQVQPPSEHRLLLELLSISSIVFAVVQFFAWDYPLPLKILFTFISVAVFSYVYVKRWRIGATVGITLVGVVTSLIVWRVTSPSEEAQFAEEYLRVTTAAHIWLSGAQPFDGAIQCLEQHYSSLKPGVYHYEYEMPDATVNELSRFIAYPTSYSSQPVVLLGQIMRSEPGPDESEYIVQIAPMSEAQRTAWSARGVGAQGVEHAHGTVEDLYPDLGIEDRDITGIVYARVKLRPLDLPVEGAPLVVRGCPIAYGRFGAFDGRNLDAVYLAGSSGRVDE